MRDWLKRTDWEIDAVVPVPLSKKRRKERGFNQAEELSRIICTTNNIESDADILLKTADAPYQAKLGFRERLENIRGVYCLNESLVGDRKKEFKDKNILLIDDVMTTGATIDECARVLKKLKPKNIYVLVLASTKGRVFETLKKN
jgi:ComF family protein